MKFNTDRVHDEVKTPISNSKEEIMQLMDTLRNNLLNCMGGTNDDDASKCWTGNSAHNFLEKFEELQNEVKTNYETLINSVETAIETQGQNVQDIDSVTF